MAGWHHWLHGCESEWTPGEGDGQGGLACRDSWGRKELDTTERLNWTECFVMLSIFSCGYWTFVYVLSSPLPILWASLMAQTVKNLPAMQETQAAHSLSRLPFKFVLIAISHHYIWQIVICMDLLTLCFIY